jgi:hypothetical protein
MSWITHTTQHYRPCRVAFLSRSGRGGVPAAGLPWFMALFGRDTLITSLQTLAFFPELAYCTLNCLAKRQALHDDPFRDAEAGKILHEERHGELTLSGQRPHNPYYGTVDATPLFLILLDEYERWTADSDLARQLEPHARAALQWLDRQEPFVSYCKRSGRGLDNQCWKDSWNSMQFHDGTLAKPPVSTIEVQGYAIAAYCAAAQLAKLIWKDRKLEQHALARADKLREAVGRHFWLTEHGYYALALDGDGRAVDSLTSNIGHLLWSGACDLDRAGTVCDLLLDDHLFSGWSANHGDLGCRLQPDWISQRHGLAPRQQPNRSRPCALRLSPGSESHSGGDDRGGSRVPISPSGSLCRLSAAKRDFPSNILPLRRRKPGPQARPCFYFPRCSAFERCRKESSKLIQFFPSAPGPSCSTVSGTEDRDIGCVPTTNSGS